MTLPPTSEIEIDLVIVLFSFVLGFVTNKRFRLLIQFLVLLFRMARWYHDTHPEGKKNADQYMYDEQMTQLYEKHLLPYDKELKESKDSSAIG